MNEKIQSRRKARDYTYKLIFSHLFTDDYDETLMQYAHADKDISEEDYDYISKTYHNAVDNKAEIVELISKYSRGYTVDRIYKADLAVLMLAIAEMKYDGEVPMGVSINEAVEICKTYSEENSNKFVNGILANIYKELNA